MAFHSDTPSSICVFHRRRCFFLLLLSNCLIAFLYLTYDFYSEKSTGNLSTYHPTAGLIIRPHSPIESIKAVLNEEYNHDDLSLFYQIVEREFSAGLRCTRTTVKPTTTPVSLSNDTATLFTSSSTLTHRLRLPPRRHRRRKFYSFSLNNSEACLNDSIDLLIVIISKSENYKTRDAIRRTWGSGKNLGNFSSIQIRFFFLIDLDEKLSENIRLENDLFHDIIQVELPQQYTLVTHRVLSLFEWSFRYCRTAKFIFKTDDDIFVNVILLLKFLSPLLSRLSNDSFRVSEMNIYGYKHVRPGVFRQADDPVGSRYVVTGDEFPCGTYPDFLSGFGYLIPKKERDALLLAAYHDYDAPFRISDVYLTGILPDYLSLSRLSMSDYTIRYQGNCENFFDDPKAFACAVGLHHGDTSDVFSKFNRYWQRVRQFL